MADLKFEALMRVLEGQRDLLASLSTNRKDKTSVRNKINATIKGFREQYEAAQTEKEKAAIYNHVADVAKGLEAAGAATGALVKAVQSGDPFAISASTLTLAASLISTISLAGGPVGAAVGAVIGAILSIISMILGLFQKESASLISEIEKLMRDLKAETQITQLRSANDHISAFSDLASKKIQRNADDAVKALIAGLPYTPPEPNKKYADIKNELNEHTIDEIIRSMHWLLTSGNQDLSLWTEVISLACQVYASYKLSIVSWLPLVERGGIEDLMDWRDSYDGAVLRFLEDIKPAARNRGIVCHAGVSGIGIRDVAISRKAKWTNLGSDTYAIAAAYRPGQDLSPNPFLSILHLANEEFYRTDLSDLNRHSKSTIEDFEKYLQGVAPAEERRRKRDEIVHALQHPFSKKKPAYHMNGQWNGGSVLNSKSENSQWRQLGKPLDEKTLGDKDIGAVYDIWAIPGTSAGEISVYTSTGDTIKEYEVQREIQRVQEFERLKGYKVGAVRAVRTKMPKPEGEADLNWNLAVYGLSGFEGINWSNPFEILAFLPPPKLKGRILPPKLFPAGPSGPDWRNYPVGIAVDRVRLWVFSTSRIACVTHADVKRCLEQPGLQSPVELAWTTYGVPTEVLGYDPGLRVSMGLRDLSACDDGLLTAVFEDENKVGRIFTATTQFEPGKPIIKPGREPAPGMTGKYIETHGWQKDLDEGTKARRVHKLPIYCWPLIEGLEDALKAKKLA